MADKILYSDIIAPDVQAQLDALTKTIKELTEELGQLRKATAKEDATAVEYNDTLRDSVELTDDLLRLIQDEIVLKKEVEKAQEKLKNTEKLSYEERNKLNAAVLKGKENLRAHGFVLRNAIKLNNAVKTSMTELSLELANNRMAYRKLSEEQRNNSKVGKVLLKTINRQDRAIKKLDAQIGNHQRNVGNYTSIVSSLSSTMRGLSPNIYKVSSAFRVYIGVLKLSKTTMAGMSKSAKVLRIALISTGIGAIVVALGTLVGMLMNSSKFTDWFSEKLAYLGGIVDGVTNFLGKMGDALFLLFSGDFTGAWAAATDAVNGFSEGMDEATKAAERLYEAEKKLKEMTQEAILQNSSYAISMANLKKKWEDGNRSIEERISLWLRWQTIRLQQANSDIAIAAQEMAALKATDEGYNEAIAKWQQAIQVRNLIKDENYLNYLKSENAAINNISDSSERLFAQYERELDYLKELAAAQKKAGQARSEAFPFEDESEIPDIPFDTAAVVADLETVEGSYQAIGNAVTGASGIIAENAKENKDIQIANALINTFAGVGMALATLPPPGSYIAAALSLAAGLANVVKMTNTQVPSYAVGTESVPETGMALIHKDERILPSDVNKHMGGIKNNDIPGLVRLGIKMPELTSGIDRMINSQQEMTRTMKRFAWVDAKGNITYLSGDRMNYV